jgi:hypothetical protein
VVWYFGGDVLVALECFSKVMSLYQGAAGIPELHCLPRCMLGAHDYGSQPESPEGLSHRQAYLQNRIFA